MMQAATGEQPRYGFRNDDGFGNRDIKFQIQRGSRLV